jgi:hypothetical protein
MLPVNILESNHFTVQFSTGLDIQSYGNVPGDVNMEDDLAVYRVVLCSVYLIFLLLLSGDVETNPGPAVTCGKVFIENCLNKESPINEPLISKEILSWQWFPRNLQI